MTTNPTPVTPVSAPGTRVCWIFGEQSPGACYCGADRLSLLSCVKEMEAKKREKQEALARHQSARRHRHRLLAKRNYKGQPNLASRVQLLLERIVSQRDGST